MNMAGMDPLTTTHLLAAVGVIAALYLLRLTHRAFFDPTSHVPGPWHTRWTSLGIDIKYYYGQRALWVHSLHQKYGPLIRLSPTEISTTDLPAIKTIYAARESFIKGPFYRALTPRDQESLFSTVRIPFHRRNRRLLAGPMAESALRATHVAAVDARVRLAVRRIGEEMKMRGAADVWNWWLFLATDTIGELTFGDSFRMLELGRVNGYAQDLQNIGKMGAIRYMFPWIFKLSANIPIPFFQRVNENTARLRHYATTSLARLACAQQSLTLLQQPEHQQSSTPLHQPTTLTDQPQPSPLLQQSTTLLQQPEQQPKKLPTTLFSKFFNADILTPAELRDQALSYILAGSDTTAVTLTYLVWAVCRNASIRRRLVDELRASGLPGADSDDSHTYNSSQTRNVSATDSDDSDTHNVSTTDSDDSQTQPSPPTASNDSHTRTPDLDGAHLRHLPYLNAVVSESLRLYSAVPTGLPRVVPPQGATLAGRFFPPGTVVGTQAYSLHRDASIFANPDVFDPSRWEAPTKSMRDAFMPFGRGARICIGLHLALIELRLATARFFLAFPDARVSALEGMSDRDMHPVTYFLLAPSGGRCLIEAS